MSYKLSQKNLLTSHFGHNHCGGNYETKMILFLWMV